MPRRFISRESKEKALELSLRGVTDGEILEYLGITKSTMKRVRRNYRRTGDVVQVPTCPGRPRILTGLNAQVSGNVSESFFFTNVSLVY